MLARLKNRERFIDGQCLITFVPRIPGLKNQLGMFPFSQLRLCFSEMTFQIFARSTYYGVVTPEKMISLRGSREPSVIVDSGWPEASWQGDTGSSDPM